MPERIVVPWLTRDRFQMKYYCHALKEYEIDTAWFADASSALRYFRSTPSPLILTELLTPSGTPPG